jgi:hypothetical protein
MEVSRSQALMAANPAAALEYLAFATAALAGEGGGATDSLQLFQHLLTERGAVRQVPLFYNCARWF